MSDAPSGDLITPPENRFAKRLVRIALLLLAPYCAIVLVMFLFQRSLLYHPSHTEVESDLKPWLEDAKTIGCCHEVSNPDTIWLMMHGNAGQAAHRDYVLDLIPDTDSFYVLEYPGYGEREGAPSKESIDKAATEAYRYLRERFPDTPVCVLGESLGSGPACMLTSESEPPDKVILVVPYDALVNVAANRYFFLPVRQLFLDRWDNVTALEDYSGQVQIFGAREDRVIPIEHAAALARQVPSAEFIRIPGGHNDWSDGGKVTISR